MAKKVNTIYQSNSKWPEDLAKHFKKLEQDAIAVGIHEDAGKHKKSDGYTVAQIGAINEYGSDGERIPERSFIRSTLGENQKTYKKHLIKALRRIMSGATGRQFMGRLGQLVQNDIQNKIVSLRTPPNAESTIAKKKTTNPLVDTGQLVNSIKWKYLKKPVTKADD